MKLRPFQREGTRFLEEKNGRAIIGDDTGLGKSAQALIFARKHKSARPMLIVCLNGLKANWENEIKLWMGPKERICNISRTPNVKLKAKNKPDSIEQNLIWQDFLLFRAFNPSIYIIHFDILFQWKTALVKLNPDLVIIDEVHLVLHYSALRTKAARLLSRRAKYFIGLTGTPIRNTNMDLFNLSKLIDTSIFENNKRFGIRYCNGKMGNWGWDFSGSSNEKELHKICSTFMIRRTYGQAMKEMPKISRITVPIDITNFEEYQKAEDDFLKWVMVNKGQNFVDKAMKALALTRMTALKQICILGKMNAIKEWIENYLYGNHKLVCIAYHKKTIQELHNHFSDNSLIISGDVKKMSDRNSAVKAFQNDKKYNLIILQLQSAIGLNLQVANTTCHIEFGWVPADHKQGEGRVKRIGQEAQSLFAYYLFAKNTIEEKIAGILNRKLSNFNKVIDNNYDQSSMLIDLIQAYGRKRKE